IEPAAIEINYLCNPIGAAMAAALGSAEVFKYVLKDELNKIGRKIDFKTLRFSCFSFIANEEKAENPALPDLIDIGDVKMIGAGAVGMAFVAVLKYLKISGSLTVIDNDIVDNSNLDRYLGVYNESIGKYKTHIVKEVLNHIEGLNVICNSNNYQHYVETYGRNMDVAICSVDNDDARQELQCDLPRIILNGATGGSTFSVSRHDFLNYACLGCLYPTDQEKFKNEEKFAQMLGVPVGVFTHKYENNIILNEFEIEKIKQYIDIPERLLNNNKGITLRSLLGDSEVCGRFKLPNDIGISGAIAFVSAMPGLLLAGELIKERYFKLDVLKNAFHVNKKRRFQCLTAACFLVRANIFKAAGGFDEVYVNGLEDIDFCLKVKELGYGSLYCPSSVVYHYESMTEGRSNFDEMNYQIFFSRWYRKIRTDHKDFMSEDKMIGMGKYLDIWTSDRMTYEKFTLSFQKLVVIAKRDGYGRAVAKVWRKITLKISN
ncbi:MAG: ThiF family adenylyltransferase, partial [Candidatus Taylorbacteria bacterium]